MIDSNGRRGLFISLDGPDGGGKTTQVARLIGRLRAEGREVTACRDPGGTPLGDKLRALLLDRSEFAICLRAEMLLYMASRAQLVEEVIRPALNSGKIVVCDRYLLANAVYQGHAGGLPVHEIWTAGLSAAAGLLPDLTVVLDVPMLVARERVGKARDRIEDRPDDYHERVRQGFLEAARNYAAPITVIDATASPDEVEERLLSEVKRVLALAPRT